MLKKKNRTDKKAIEKIFKEGRFINFPDLTFKYILRATSPTCGERHMSDLWLNSSPRISFIAPKSVVKLAVKRNLLRRKGYNVLQKYINDFPAGIMGVFIFKTRPNGRGPSVGREYQDDTSIIENEIKNILAKIN